MLSTVNSPSQFLYAYIVSPVKLYHSMLNSSAGNHHFVENALVSYKSVMHMFLGVRLLLTIVVSFKI